MILDNYKFSTSSSLRLKKKNILFFFEEDVKNDTHHISALFFDIKRYLKQEEYKFLKDKFTEKQLQIIDFVAVHTDEMAPCELLNQLGQFEKNDLIFVHKTLEYEFDSAAFNNVECLFELAIQMNEEKVIH